MFVRGMLLGLVLVGCGPSQSREDVVSPVSPPPATVVEVAPATSPSLDQERLATPPDDYLQLPTSAVCRLQGDEGALVGALHLRVEGRRFATVVHVKRADVVVNGTGARAVVTARGMTIGGEVLPAMLMLRPVEPVTHEGWLHVRRMRVSETGADGTLRAAVALPAVLADRPVQVSVACSNASLTGDVEAPRGGQSSHIDSASSVPLRLVPGGSVFATVRPPPPSGPDAISAVEWTDTLLLERRGPWARIRIVGPNSWVEGWTDGGVVGKGEAHDMLAMLSGGFPRGERFLSCPRELSVYVRPGTEPLRVAIASPGAKVRVLSKAPLESLVMQREVPVDLGDDSLSKFWADSDEEPTLQPFLLGDSLAGCELSS